MSLRVAYFMKRELYDFIIVGAGAAGLHLALAMLSDDWSKNKRILILDKDLKDQNDKTWSYWEQAEGKWDHIIRKSWTKGMFYGNQLEIPLNLHPYRYKTLHAIDFYKEAKRRINQADQISWMTEEVVDLSFAELPVQVKTDANLYYGHQVFDSRVEMNSELDDASYYHILQHFKGWQIKTAQPSFDPESFTMMDYRLKWKDSTSFTYVLPFTAREAIVEFTLFNQELLSDEGYEELLRQYIEEILQIREYEITAVEQGVIPMSDAPFHLSSTDHVTKIGQAGSWVKPSTGYSFKRAELFSQQIVQNLKAGIRPDIGLLSKKFRFYDSVLLGILHDRNHLGELVFSTMYEKNDIQQIFKFLDNQTSLAEDLKIMSRFQYTPFLLSLKQYALR